LGLGLKWNEELDALGLMKKQNKTKLGSAAAPRVFLFGSVKKKLESTVLTDLK
jgi:hypothetical protein